MSKPKKPRKSRAKNPVISSAKEGVQTRQSSVLANLLDQQNDSTYTTSPPHASQTTNSHQNILYSPEEQRNITNRVNQVLYPNMQVAVQAHDTYTTIMTKQSAGSCSNTRKELYGPPVTQLSQCTQQINTPAPVERPLPEPTNVVSALAIPENEQELEETEEFDITDSEKTLLKTVRKFKLDPAEITITVKANEIIVVYQDTHPKDDSCNEVQTNKMMNELVGHSAQTKNFLQGLASAYFQSCISAFTNRRMLDVVPGCAQNDEQQQKETQRPVEHTVEDHINANVPSIESRMYSQMNQQLRQQVSQYNSMNCGASQMSQLAIAPSGESHSSNSEMQTQINQPAITPPTPQHSFQNTIQPTQQMTQLQVVMPPAPLYSYQNTGTQNTGTRTRKKRTAQSTVTNPPTSNRSMMQTSPGFTSQVCFPPTGYFQNQNNEQQYESQPLSGNAMNENTNVTYSQMNQQATPSAPRYCYPNTRSKAQAQPQQLQMNQPTIPLINQPRRVTKNRNYYTNTYPNNYGNAYSNNWQYQQQNQEWSQQPQYPNMSNVMQASSTYMGDQSPSNELRDNRFRTPSNFRPSHYYNH